MDGRMTLQDVQREYALRLRDGETRAQAANLRCRLRLRRQLHRAIEEVVRIEGRTEPVAQEIAGLIRKTETQLGGRACC